MHYHAEVYINNNEDVDEQLRQIMVPYHYEKQGGFYDWYQIGGRWTGTHVENYNPENDPLNRETCYLCQGTGLRNDPLGKQTRLEDPSYTCNGCSGNGIRAKWPTEWARYEQDVIAIDQIKPDFSCYTLIVDGQVFHQEHYVEGKWEDNCEFNGNVLLKLTQLGITTGYLVTVDYHS